MKNLVFILLFSFQFVMAHAQDPIKVYDPSNNLIGSYQNITDAVAAAVPNSVIQLISGTYGDVTLDKPLHFVGAGYSGVNATTLGNIYLGANTNGSTFKGFRITYLYGNGNGTSVISIDDITISNCYLNKIFISGSSSDHSTNWTVSNNIINRLAGNEFVTNTIFKNNIIWGNPCIYGFYETSIIFDHNNIVWPTPMTLSSNITLTNNIFYSNSISCTDCSFSYNVSYAPVAPAPSFPCESSICSNNIIREAPIFIDVPQQGFSLTYDYHLSDISLKTADSSGGEVGIYGGTSPFTGPAEFRFMIVNPVIEQNGSLEIKIEGE